MLIWTWNKWSKYIWKYSSYNLKMFTVHCPPFFFLKKLKSLPIVFLFCFVLFWRISVFVFSVELKQWLVWEVDVPISPLYIYHTFLSFSSYWKKSHRPINHIFLIFKHQWFLFNYTYIIPFALLFSLDHRILELK